ncbi:MAG: tripartite tricarboxylate transporter substrate binding protein [Pseudolabrys sp.]|nr:tripartite tricarboxylate transporter substrate binding protein [Pseudolabrys sp.]
MSSTITRRRLLGAAGAAAVLAINPRPLLAQTYPNRPVRLVAPFAAGGPTDIVARLTGQWLSERLGQQFVIENRPGAGGTVGTEAVVRAAPDGYTLLQVAAYNVVNAALYDNLNFNFARDITPVASMMSVPLVMVVSPSLPAKTIPEFIAYAKANPGKISMASSGIGATPHISGELFKMMAGVDLVHVPYRGAGPAFADLIGGQVQMMFDFIPSSVEYVRSGKLRALGVTSTTRAAALPDVAPIREFVPGYEASGWFGLGAPKGTPSEIVDALNKAMNAILSDDKVKARLADLGGTPLAGSTADFGKLIAVESEKWAKVVKFSGVKPG